MFLLQNSGSKYGTLLNRASLIMGQTPMKSDVQGLKDLESTVESTVKAAKFSGSDLDVAFEMKERVKAKLQVTLLSMPSSAIKNCLQPIDSE